MAKCDTCAHLAELPPPHDAYCVCLWKAEFPLPANALLAERASLQGDPTRLVSRWISKAVVFGGARTLMKDCPAHKRQEP